MVFTPLLNYVICDNQKMNLQTKIKICKSYDLFASLDEKELELFAEKMSEHIFPAKTVILAQAKPASRIYFMYKGLVKIYILEKGGKILPIRVTGPTYIIGEMNLFDNESTASIETIQETYTLTCSKDDLLSLIKTHPSLSFSLLTILNEKLRAANKQAEYYFSIPLRDRTLKILHTLAPHFPASGIDLSQEELSSIIGASRARVTEALDELSIQKRIFLSRRNIKLL